jgi:hypothetical protein
MLYQLPTGRVIEISTEQYLEMSDEELEYLIAYNYGETVEDPWFGSILKKREITSNNDDEEISSESSDIVNITPIDKLTDLDIDKSLTEE